LREQQCREGLIPHDKPSAPSACSAFDTVAQECAGRIEALAGQARVFRQQLPVLLKRLRKIPDPRHPKKTKHQLTVLMIYGILVFVLQYTSRRQANAGITHPMIGQNLHLLFPELESIPHADTLFRLLRRMDVSEIEQAQIDLVNQLIRRKKFMPWRVNNCYPLAIDGTQKLGGLELWSEQQLQYRLPSCDPETGDEPSVHHRYTVYVLEANLSFRNGMLIPLMTEFLDYREGDSEREKQDCETRAFHRLAERIKKAFPRLPLMLLLDGLYAQGPVMQRCHDYHWQFMIVLKDDSLNSVWQEYFSLLELQPGNEHQQHWGNRRQHFRWINHIHYEYGPNTGRHIDLHVVVCNEQWEEVNVAAVDEAGLNYGWNVLEGTHCYEPSSGCSSAGTTLPIYEYGHGQGCSITGGYVYRDDEVTQLIGHYVYADFCTGVIRSFRYAPGVGVDSPKTWNELGSVGQVYSFGVDASDRLYVMAGDSVLRFTTD